MSSFKPREPTPAEREAIFAELDRERPRIDRARKDMVEALRGLSGLGQKAAIQGFLTAWVVTITASNEEAKALADGMAAELSLFVEDMLRHRPKPQ